MGEQHSNQGNPSGFRRTLENRGNSSCEEHNGVRADENGEFSVVSVPFMCGAGESVFAMAAFLRALTMEVS